MRYAGGISLPPVQKLVATIQFSAGKLAVESLILYVQCSAAVPYQAPFAAAFAEVFFRYKRIFYRSYRHIALASFRVGLFSLCTGINAVSTIYFEQFILPKHIMLHVISAVFALTIVHLYHLSKHYRVYNSKSQ